MAKVLVLTTYCDNGEKKTSQYIANVKDVRKYFNNAICDAVFLSQTYKGEITIDRTDKTICINYQNVPGIIERKRIVL